MDGLVYGIDEAMYGRHATAPRKASLGLIKDDIGVGGYDTRYAVLYDTEEEALFRFE